MTTNRGTRVVSHNQRADGVVSRRDMLAGGALGFGLIALADLLRAEGRLAAAEPGAEDVPFCAVPHRPARAKNVIFVFLGGGPSHVDTFDPKPLLAELAGKEVPESIAKDIPRIARSPLHGLLPSPWKFRRHGESGLELSQLMPHLAARADDLCVIRSCRHETPIHAPAEFLTTTGSQFGERPSLGAWLSYGLGSENRDLPAFVVFNEGGTFRPPAAGTGFLPARHQGILVDAERGIPHLALPEGVTREERTAQLDLLGTLNRRHAGRHPERSELDARIRSYELAFRMQRTAPEAFDLSRETAATQALYGIGAPGATEFSKYCLWARRLVERGVRFVQIRSGKWDAHTDILGNHAERFAATDRAVAGLLADLAQRGLLESTLVVWGGEFGRTPAAQRNATKPGRDHSPSGYTMWLAGGGVRGGRTIGATDPVGYAAVERPVHPRDLHATILHALGIDQRRLWYEHHNRRELVTVNGGTVLEDVFA